MANDEAMVDERRPVARLADQEVARLASLAELDLLDTEPEDRFDRLTSLAARVFAVPMAQVNLVEHRRSFAKARYGGGFDDHAFCSRTVDQSSVLIVEDALIDERFDDEGMVADGGMVRFYAGYPLYGPGGYPVGALSIIDTKPRRFDRNDEALLESMAQLVEREMNNRDEVERAAMVQHRLLPAGPPDVAGYTVRGRCIPARRVGGDFYDWYVVRDHLVVTVADVMGKGMGAAILAASVRAALRSETRQAGIAEAVVSTGLGMADDLDATNSFVTLFHAAFSDSGRVTYADAGHGLAVVVPADPTVGPSLLAPRGLPLGVLDSDPGLGQLDLAPGDTLVIVSDGLLDLAPELPEAAELIASLVRGGLDRMGERVAALVAETIMTDDITWVAVQRNP